MSNNSVLTASLELNDTELSTRSRDMDKLFRSVGGFAKDQGTVLALLTLGAPTGFEAAQLTNQAKPFLASYPQPSGFVLEVIAPDLVRIALSSDTSQYLDLRVSQL